MNDRERWTKTFRFQPVDHVLDIEFGYWDDTLKRWHSQGLPAEIDDNNKAHFYFGFSKLGKSPGVDVGLLPLFEHRVLEEDDETRVVIDGSGVKLRERKDGGSIPFYLEFPIKDRATAAEHFRRLNPKTPGRYPQEWEELLPGWRDRDYPLGLSVGSIFGWVRNWMGLEGVSMALYDDPALVEDLMEAVTSLVCETIPRALGDVDFDFGHFWEDMAYVRGPMLSPRHFEELMVPRYRRITDLMSEHGVEFQVVDCDGRIDELVPLWLDAGVNIMFPLEIAAGSDPWKYREEFGQRVMLLGGVDKRALISGPKAIEAELDRLIPLVEMGGYIPHVDHRVPPDVSYQNYLYYLDAKRERLGVPRPASYEERRQHPELRTSGLG